VTGIYYTDAAAWLRGAGLEVVECDGWEDRARSSGGFANPPLGIQWHHTASSTTPENDTGWQTEGSDDAPIGNATIMRDGSIWLVAAGASNTAGKGGPLTLSRGTVPLDSGNSTTWAWEVANSGVGERWPQIQVDAYFAATIEMNKRFGNAPTDVFTHAIGASDCKGWTDRKIDPATAAAVEGPWKPRSVNSSGTWHLGDIRAELERRAAGTTPPPEPEPAPEDEVTDSDIEKIAKRAADLVWGRQFNVACDKTPAAAGSILGWTYAAVIDDDSANAAAMAAPQAMEEPE
jgi:hypothetical protein